jgi:hypothetical protein
MQDRYAGDVGDFMKLGLLRALASQTGLELGVNWYLAPEESHNADGKHVAYLEASHPQHAALRRSDADLLDRLAAVVAGERSVAALEASGALPAGSITFSRRLGDGAFDRPGWHSEALQRLAPAEVVFADPDNGIRAKRRGSKGSKFAFLDELADYADRGQSLVVYHHADRSAGGVPAQVGRRLAELREATRAEPTGAVIARRGSTRFFFVVPAEHHRAALSNAVQAYAERWRPHAEFAAYVPART